MRYDTKKLGKKVIIILLMLLLINLFGCDDNNEQLDFEAINEIVLLIDELPVADDITLDDKDKVLKIREKVARLSDNELKEVINYYDFLEIENKIKNMDLQQEELIININNEIDKLCSKEITLVDEESIRYIDNMLSSLYSNNESRITNLIEYNIIKIEFEELVQKEIENVNKLIMLIPNEQDITLSDENIIIEAREMYEKLTESAKLLVQSYEDLEKAEAIIENLKDLEIPFIREIMQCIEDVVTSDTNHLVITTYEKYTVEWISSNNDLLYFEDNCLKVSKVNQTHKKQYVTVTANITSNAGELYNVTKTVTVNPVKFSEMPDTPVATYFQTGALSSYKNYSDRYKSEGTLFSEKSKKVLDIIYYAFANIDAYGNVYMSDTSIVNDLILMKEYDTRIIMCISGVSEEGSKNFATITASDSMRKRFVGNVMDMVEKYNFDGVDIDWESTSGSYVIADRMNKLMADLRAEMDKRQDKGGTNYLLTAAIPATSWGAGSDRFDFYTLNKYVDYINMMSYDLNKSSNATHLSPLYSSNWDKGYGFSCDYGVKLFISRGLDKNKIIIGSAGYGKAYKILEKNSNSKYPYLGVTAELTQLKGVAGAYASGTVFINAITQVLNTGKYKKYIEYTNDGKVVGSYLYNESENIFITYDSEEVIAEKYKYAYNNEGMGIMCWAYTEDTSDNYIDSIYNLLDK